MEYRVKVVDVKAAVYSVEAGSDEEAIKKLDNAINRHVKKEPDHLMDRSYMIMEKKGE